jgi:cell division protein FtsW (lipid II flippase)
MFERIFSRIDWSIVTITILITGIGLIALASISPQMIVKSGNDPFSKQMGMAIVGILLIFVVGVISPKYIYNMVWPRLHFYPAFAHPGSGYGENRPGSYSLDPYRTHPISAL